jgi:hypothetical protein
MKGDDVMRRLWAEGTSTTTRLLRSTACLLPLGLVMTSVTACSELRVLVKGAVGDWDRPDRDVPCEWLGDAFRLSGSFLQVPQNWTPTTNAILLQYDRACTDVVGYGELFARLDDPIGGRTDISTARISFKGSREDLDSARFEGTVYVDYDLKCEGDCDGSEPYAFDYPATWWAEIGSEGETTRGWLDGYGDFLLDERVQIDAGSYREVPGLEIWPKTE